VTEFLFPARLTGISLFSCNSGVLGGERDSAEGGAIGREDPAQFHFFFEDMALLTNAGRPF
jgi:hypothetical protein